MPEREPSESSSHLDELPLMYSTFILTITRFLRNNDNCSFSKSVTPAGDFYTRESFYNNGDSHCSFVRLQRRLRSRYYPLVFVALPVSGHVTLSYDYDFDTVSNDVNVVNQRLTNSFVHRAPNTRYINFKPYLETKHIVSVIRVLTIRMPYKYKMFNLFWNI